jgi:hypothetical protein
MAWIRGEVKALPMNVLDEESWKDLAWVTQLFSSYFAMRVVVTKAIPENSFFSSAS